MSRLLCLFGLHFWATHKRRLSHWDCARNTYRVYQYCKRCRKEREFLELDEPK